MASNKSVRQQLEMLYGKGCMFKRALNQGVLGQEQTKTIIKSYKKYIEITRYKSKKIKQLEKSMTYHHLQHDSEGGPTSVQNGAVVSELAHRYIHSLPRHKEEVINDMLREYKQSFQISGGILSLYENGLHMETPFAIDYGDFETDGDFLEITAYDTTEKTKQKFNRAKTKQDTQKLIQKALDENNER